MDFNLILPPLLFRLICYQQDWVRYDRSKTKSSQVNMGKEYKLNKKCSKYTLNKSSTSICSVAFRHDLITSDGGGAIFFAFTGQTVDEILKSSLFCIRGKWTNFDNWKTCSKSCGNGQMTRERKCKIGQRIVGDEFCDDDQNGGAVQVTSCKIADCQPKNTGQQNTGNTGFFYL